MKQRGSSHTGGHNTKAISAINTFLNEAGLEKYSSFFNDQAFYETLYLIVYFKAAHNIANNKSTTNTPRASTI